MRVRHQILAGVVASVFAASASSYSQAATLYVTQYSNNQVLQFTNAGNAQTSYPVAGAGPTFTTFTSPYGVAVDGAGDVYIEQYNAQNLQGFTSTGAFLGSISTIGNGPSAQLFQAGGNQLYVSTLGSTSKNNGGTGNYVGSVNQVTESVSGGSVTFTPGNSYWMIANAGGSPGTFQSAVANYGAYTYVFASNNANGEVTAVNTNSSATFNTPAYAQLGAGITSPVGIAIDSAGNIYADTLAGKIYQIVPTFTANDAGISSMSASLIATTGTTSTELDGMAFGPDGNLYLADLSNKTIDEVNIDGDGTTAEPTVVAGVTTNAVVSTYLTTAQLGGDAPFSLAFGLTVTPEPASLGLLALCAGGMILRRRKQ